MEENSLNQVTFDERIYVTYSNASGIPYIKSNIADHMAVHYIDKNGSHRVIEAGPTNKFNDTLTKN